MCYHAIREREGKGKYIIFQLHSHINPDLYYLLTETTQLTLPHLSCYSIMVHSEFKGLPWLQAPYRVRSQFKGLKGKDTHNREDGEKKSGA